jgi:hypothetical protein
MPRKPKVKALSIDGEPVKHRKPRNTKVKALNIDEAHLQKVHALTVDFAKNVLCGWVGQDIAKSHFDLIGGDLPTFHIVNSQGSYQGKRQMLWEFTRKALGKDTDNFSQQVGDCTSFGGKNAMEYLQCVQIALAGEQQKFRNIFPPYIYGCSRVFIGGGDNWGDGGSGAWVQAAVKKYGVIAVDDPGVPAYSGGIARQWGGGHGPPQEFITLGKEHLVKTTAQITNADDAANALLNGYPMIICSDRGYNMLPSSDGFHAPRGTWSHCLSLIGFDDSDSSKGLYFIILNSWGDVHGHLKDFASGADLPVGILRVRAEYVDKMLAEGDSFAFSQFDGFPDNSVQLEKAMFDLVGD